MPRYVAFLRGVSPMNAKMSELKACFETLGFGEVKTVLSSGNVVFTSPAKSEAALAKTLEAGFARHLPRGFPVIVRSAKHLQALLDADPYASIELPPGAKRVVTFLNEAPRAAPQLPIEDRGARVLALRGHELLSAYVPHADGPVFMGLIEKTFGKDLTTRTWETVRKCAAA